MMVCYIVVLKNRNSTRLHSFKENLDPYKKITIFSEIGYTKSSSLLALNKIEYRILFNSDVYLELDTG
jgi:hypothetical protein